MQNSSYPPPHTENTGIHAALRSDSIERLFDQLKRVVAIHLAMPAALVLAVWDHVDHNTLITWTVLALLVVLWRYLLVRAFYRRTKDEARSVAWAHHSAVTSLATGLLWGSAVWLFLVPESAPHQALLYVLIIGHAAGSVIVTAYWLPSFYAYLVPALGLTIAKLLFDGGPANDGLAALLLVFSLILHGVAKAQHAAAQSALRLRYENLELVDQLKAQMEAAENANRAKSMFLASASHDLRQPLHALNLFSSALSEKSLDYEIRELATHIGHSVAALTKLFDALLDISRLDAGVIKPQLQHFQLEPVFDQLAREFNPVATSRGLKWVDETEPLVAFTDQALLELIIRNLITNAIRYTDRGEVRLRCARSEHGILIEVSDTGRGIPLEHQEKIFGEFFQLQNPERDRTKGLGLGLAIVRRLAALLDVKVRVMSAPGHGTTFSLSVCEGDASAIAAPKASVDLSEILGRIPSALILVIDDELTNLEATRILLEGWGYEVALAGSGAEALETLAEMGRTPEVIIADYRLRDSETGINAVIAIRRALGHDVPAILVSGDTAPDRLREVKENGFTMLHKPLQPARLRTLLNSLMQQRAASSAATTS